MKRLILVFAGVTVLGVAIIGVLGLRTAYRNFKVSRGLRQARAFLAAGDLASASVNARQVLQTDSLNVEACRIMAELTELCHSPATIGWRHRIVEMSPTIPNRLKLAGSALRFHRPPYRLSEQILQEIQPVSRDLPTFHVVSAELAVKSGMFDKALAHFQEASRLEPANPLHQLNTAVLHLLSTNCSIAEAARGVLIQLSTNAYVRPRALRWLIADSVRRDNLAEAKQLSEELLYDPTVELDDRLQHLGILQRAMDLPRQMRVPVLSAARCAAASVAETAELPIEASGPNMGSASKQSVPQEFTECLYRLKKDVATNAVELNSVCDWMGHHGLADEALKWLAGLGAELRHAQPVSLAEANLYLAKADWLGLEAFLEKQKWRELEFLRLALLARAAWGQNRAQTGEACWSGAARSASDRLGALTLLLSLAAEWGRDPEDLLWTIARRFPGEDWALRELEKRYVAVGNTCGLNRLYAMWEGSRKEPDWTNRNNFAVTSMLLKVDLARAHDTARELYGKNPGDPIVASTYGYSLHLQGRTGEGLAIFEKLQPTSLDSPSLALYYGVLLSAAGQTDQANRYLALAERANLLPEERELMARAKSMRF
jgi:predicted Zn-dependent protease